MINIIATSVGVDGFCYTTGKNIVFSWASITDPEETTINNWFTAYPFDDGAYKVEIRIFNANTLVDVVALTELDADAASLAAIEALDYTWLPTIPALYTFEITLTPGRQFINGFWTYYDQLALVETFDLALCPFTDLTKIACYEYLLYRPTGLTVPPVDTVYDVVLTNLDESLELTFEWNVFTYDSIRVLIPEDGVYLLTITNQADALDTYSFPIYEFCQLEYCFRNLVLKLWCTDALTPCCDDCDENATKQALAIRAYLNKIIALMGSLLAYVYNDRLTFLGINCVDSCRQLDMTKISGLVTKINETTAECGAGCGNTDCYENFVSDCGCTPGTVGITGEINIVS